MGAECVQCLCLKVRLAKVVVDVAVAALAVSCFAVGRFLPRMCLSCGHFAASRLSPSVGGPGWAGVLAACLRAALGAMSRAPHVIH